MISADVKLGSNVKIHDFVNLYGCVIGDNTKVGPFVEIQRGAVVGKRCKISSHSFICDGVEIGDDCFVGHGVMFVNDNFPRSVNAKGELEEPQDWQNRFKKTIIGTGVSIGTNATIIGGVHIGDGVLIGAGAVVTKNIPQQEIWAGNPARFLRLRH